MKQGNQFYLETQLFDEDDNLLDISSIKKVQFNIGELTKTFDFSNEEVEYNEEIQTFRIWITEQESFKFENKIKIDARVLFKNDVIQGSMVEQLYVHDSLNEVYLDDSSKDN